MRSEFAAPELVLDLVAHFGVTPWENAARNPPSRIGWYNTRRVDAPKLLQGQRRWWDGETFSAPCTPGTSDADAECVKGQPTLLAIEALEWSGLKGPYPGFKE